ncbi:LysR family transcriptional regulator [Pendulispora brunnea]|uniref:LysR family transcriptional regulator n=1 Tax=Pendulispora brunnea TaxID=2905690 RepID=A0ABZ2KIV9_9BACT
MLRVAEKGSLAAGARALGVNHTTALRRVHAFERRLGVRLFERLAKGYVLTAAGEELMRTAQQMDEMATSVERRISGRDLRLTGSVRVTTTDTLAVSIVPPHLAAFRRKHPDVHLELTTSNAVLSLSKRDADVAIRPSGRPPENANLVGRRIAEIAFALYAAPSYLADHRTRDLARHLWIAPDDSLGQTAVAEWMARELPHAVDVLRCDSFVAMRTAAVAGLGVVALPCYLGDPEPGLERVRGPLANLTSELWILTHEDLRGTARIRAFTEFMAEALIREQRGLIQGRGRGA